jgi:fructose-bisphosphate aldolase/2-amino-3,7-dideoxy-D-threo-hept-6-ulosonate synthase
MSTGRTIRLSRLFNAKSKCTVILPMDHGVEGYFPELSNPSSLIASLADVGPNGFILRRGIVRQTCSSFAGKASLVLRVTTATCLRDKFAEQAYTAFVEEAVRLGADAVVPNVFIGSDRELEDLHNLGILADACDRWGMPLIGEVFPIGDENTKPFDGPYKVEEVREAVRIGAEEGCDVIKTCYTGDPESFRRITNHCPVPVIISGGPKGKTPDDTLRMVDGALQGGAKGICLGRRVWGSKDPVLTLKVLKEMVHERLPLKEAVKELKRG